LNVSPLTILVTLRELFGFENYAHLESMAHAQHTFHWRAGDSLP